jgi:hypothetical protein
MNIKQPLTEGSIKQNTKILKSRTRPTCPPPKPK